MSTQPKQQEIFKTADGSKQIQKTNDGFQNFMARLGITPKGEGQQNMLSHGHYGFNLMTRNRIALEAAYRGSWIVGQVVDCVAEDMTRAGIEITAGEDAEEIAELKAYMSRLQVWQRLCDTIKWSRLYGGVCGIMQIRGQDLATPINLDSIGEGDFLGITPYDRWQLYPAMDKIINEGPDMGLPEFYDIVLGTNLNDPGQEPGGSHTDSPNGRVRVHHSRCIRMLGIQLPFWQAITEMMWGESVLERMWDRLIEFDDATANVGNLIHKAYLRRVGIEGLREILAAGGEAQAALVQHFEMMRQMASNEGLTLLDKNDEYSADSYTFAGLSDVLMQFGQQVSGACSPPIPLVRLFGQSPAGLSATGESDIRLYYDGINAKQESMLRNPLEILLRVLWRSMTGKPAPKDLAFTFTPLWQMSAVDKATVAKTNTDTIVEAHEAGGIDTPTMMRELKDSSEETGLFNHITDEMIEEAENEAPPEPELGQPAEEPPAQKIEEAAKPEKAKDSAWQKIKRFVADAMRTTDPGMAGTMREFEAGTLKSSSGEKVTSRKQAQAIGMSQERKTKDAENEKHQKLIRDYVGSLK
jgi:uncharacterized protein